MLPVGAAEPLQPLSLAMVVSVAGLVLACHAWVLRPGVVGACVTAVGWLVWCAWGGLPNLMGV